MRPLIYGLLATTAFIPGAFAESKCAFNKNATTKFEHKIEKSEVVKRVILDLDKKQVFLDELRNKSEHIVIDGLPNYISYGNHYYTLSWEDSSRYK